MEPRQLTRRPEVSVYKQISDYYADQIRSGDIQPQGKMPSRPQIAATWGVSPKTAERAVIALRDAGLVETNPKGTFALSAPQ